MTNEKRNQRLLQLAVEGLRTVWPDRVSVRPSEVRYGRMYYNVCLRMTQASNHKEDPDLQNIECSLPELFQLIAGITSDFEPDLHWVFDHEKNKIVVIDAVDYNESVLADRFSPLPPLHEGEHYDQRVEEGRPAVYHVTPKGEERVLLE